MNMEKANASSQFKRIGEGELRASIHPLLKVHSILAHDIVHHQGHGNAFHVIWKWLAETIVHVDLPDGGGQLSLLTKIERMAQTFPLSENPLQMQG